MLVLGALVEVSDELRSVKGLLLNVVNLVLAEAKQIRIDSFLVTKDPARVLILARSALPPSGMDHAQVNDLSEALHVAYLGTAVCPRAGPGYVEHVSAFLGLELGILGRGNPVAEARVCPHEGAILASLLLGSFLVDLAHADDTRKQDGCYELLGLLNLHWSLFYGFFSAGLRRGFSHLKDILLFSIIKIL